jgi:hypothetical protein
MPMLIDKKGKLFGKISIVDFVIVLVILAVIAGVYYKFGRGLFADNEKAENMIISLYWEEVPDYVVNSIKVGDIVIEDIQKAEFGHVKDVKVDKSVSWAQTDKGEYVKSTKEGYSSINISVEGKGELSGQGYNIGSYTFYIGKNYVVRIANSMINVRISDIRRKE